MSSARMESRGVGSVKFQQGFSEEEVGLAPELCSSDKSRQLLSSARALTDISFSDYPVATSP